MVKEFPADSPEVLEFRKRIYVEDLGLSEQDLSTFNDPTTDNKFAYWYSDHKFLSNGFDRVLLYYHNNEPVSMAGGTLYNKNLYRCLQMLYILKSARRVPELNTLHFKDNGFFDHHIKRAKKLKCRGLFYSVDPYDTRHRIMYEYLKRNKSSMAHMPMAERKYNADHFIFPDEHYEIKYTKQNVAFFPLGKQLSFNELFYDT